MAAMWIVPAAANACDKNFVVYNQTSSSITQFFVSPHSSDNWEDDLLTGSSSIEPDTSWRINMESDTRDLSLYDVKAILDDGTKVEGGKINLCRATKVYIYDDRVTYE
jgi:hypothetical protein